MTPGKAPRQKKAPPPPTPKQQNPWDQRPFPVHGDTDIQTTYAAVGMALSAWEEYEQKLVGVYAAIIGWRADLITRVQRAYGSILTLRGRVEMIEAAAEAFFDEYPDARLESVVKAQLNGAKDYGVRRNELAHGIVRKYNYQRGVPSEYALHPCSIATKKFMTDRAAAGMVSLGTLRRPKYAYSSVEIDYYRIAFEGLARGASSVWAELVQTQLQRQRTPKQP